MGLLPLVAPFIEEKEKELQRTQSLTKDLSADVATIFVEGKTDKEIISLAIELFSQSLKMLIQSQELRIYTRDGEGGCLKINDNVCAWIYSGNRSKIIAIYDKDEAGNRAYQELINNSLYKDKKLKNVKTLLLPPNETIKGLYKQGIQFLYELEHLYSISCWKRIIEAGYAEERAPNELHQMLGAHANRHKSSTEMFEQLVNDKDIRETIVYHKPSTEVGIKSKIVQMICNSPKELQLEYLDGLKPLICEIEKRFIISDDKNKMCLSTGQIRSQ